MYSDIAEIRKVNIAEANLLLTKGWKILDIKTVTEKKYLKTITTQSGWTIKYAPIYDETERIVYIVGRPAVR